MLGQQHSISTSEILSSQIFNVPTKKQEKHSWKSNKRLDLIFNIPTKIVHGFPLSEHLSATAIAKKIGKSLICLDYSGGIQIYIVVKLYINT